MLAYSQDVQESSSSHINHRPPAKRNPHANIIPEERFSRLCMFLEAQFGQVRPITRPKLAVKASKPYDEDGDVKVEAEEPGMEEAEAELAEMEAAELERLHSVGIPVPGVEIIVDQHIAKVWLETLEVECGWPLLRDRVRAVVERAVETVAPLWAPQRS